MAVRLVFFLRYRCLHPSIPCTCPIRRRLLGCPLTCSSLSPCLPPAPPSLAPTSSSSWPGSKATNRCGRSSCPRRVRRTPIRIRWGLRTGPEPRTITRAHPYVGRPSLTTLRATPTSLWLGHQATSDAKKPLTDRPMMKLGKPPSGGNWRPNLVGCCAPGRAHHQEVTSLPSRSPVVAPTTNSAHRSR